MPLGIDLFGPSAPATRRPVLDMGGLEASCSRLRLALGMGPSLDTASLLMASAQVDLGPGDSLTIAMGYEDGETTAVFTGTVSAVTRTIEGAALVRAGNGGEALARTRLNQSFVGMSAGDIIRDLAGRAGVAVAEMIDGPDLPLFVADDRSSALELIAVLSRFSGADVSFDPDGGLVCALSGESQAVTEFSYGASLARGSFQSASAPTTPIRTVGEGAAGSGGEDAWPWFLADSASVASGDEGGALRSVAALRSADAVATANDAAVALIARDAATVSVEGPGTPSLRPGTLFSIDFESLGGDYVAREVLHTFSKTSGFVTRVTAWRADGASGGLPGGVS